MEEENRRRRKKKVQEELSVNKEKWKDKRYVEGCLTCGSSSWNSRISGLYKKNALLPFSAFTKVCSHFPIVALFLFYFLIFFDKSVFGSWHG
jgi:hypothetical protein